MNKFQKEFWNCRVVFLLKITEPYASFGFFLWKQPHCKVQLCFIQVRDLRM